MKPLALLIALALCTGAGAQTTPAPRTEAAPEATGLATLSWLEGCWRGTVNQREYREHWMPLRGGMLIGVSQTVGQGKTLDYEYLRIEERSDGVYYVAIPPGKKETSFRLSGQAVDRAQDRNDQIFTFANAAREFPERIVYRRASDGWLYAAVEGKVNGEDKVVTYPMRRIDCESGDFILR